MNISREKMEELSKLYNFELSEKEKDFLSKDFERLERGLAILNKINTDGIEPMVYGSENITSYMREDRLSENLSLVEVLENAPKIKDNYFVGPRVVE